MFPLKIPSFLGRIVMFADKNQAFCMQIPDCTTMTLASRACCDVAKVTKPQCLALGGGWRMASTSVTKICHGFLLNFPKPAVDFPDVLFFLVLRMFPMCCGFNSTATKNIGITVPFFPGDFLWKMSKSIHRTSAANTTIWMGWGQCTLHSTSLNTTVDLKHYEYKWI